MTYQNIIQRLKELAATRPNDVIYNYVEDEKKPPVSMTYAEVDAEAKKIASNLLATGKKGDRALMLYPAGLEFISAFYGCLYAGMVAVPAYPPRKNQKISRLKSIISDADAAVVMTSQKAALVSKPLFEEDETLQGLVWLESDSAALAATDEKRVEAAFSAVEGSDLAFLQYTSGSTGNPKGVMISHGNLMSNMEVIYLSCDYDEHTRSVSWLPHFHDMGLMGGVIEPLYSGTEITFMAPAYFLQKPIRWIELISHNKATHIAGPNFAYDLCTEKVSEEDLKNLDMSHLKIALNGSEPVHAETLRRFTEKFSLCGFKSKAHYPSYGMAETTLLVTGGNADEEAIILNIDAADLQNGKITIRPSGAEGSQEMVSSGHSWTDHEVKIVDMKNFKVLEEDTVGEVWVCGSSIAQGYWKNPEKTEEDFHAYTAEKEGPYLRTGDLAFEHEGELYICGRAKDLLIIRGKNYYPQDIEMAVSASHEALSQGGTAAFSLEIDEREQLVIVQEIQRTHMRKFNEEEVLDAMIETIGVECELQVYDILLVRPGQVLKTSSGKIQRQANKQAYIDKTYKVLGELRKESTEKAVLVKTASAPVVDENEDAVTAWLRSEISTLTQTAREKVTTEKNFMVFGLDSLASVQLQDAIIEHFSIELPLMAFYDFPTIAELAPEIAKLAEKSKGKSIESRELPEIVPSSETKFEKFNLNNIQQAYLLGRRPDMTLGNTACYAYAEIGRVTLDLERLEQAWNKLMQRHEMLRCVMHEDITQQYIEEMPYQVLPVYDISDMSEEDALIYLANARERKVTELPDPSRLPLVSLEAYILPDGTKKIHIYVDMLVCDASSMFIFLEDLHYYYRFPDTKMERLEISFKDYLSYADKHKEGKLFDASLAYWRARLDTLPSGPALALVKQPVEIKKPKFTRRTFVLEAEKWARFKKIVAHMNATPTAVLLALYGKTLATWSNSGNFCINLTHFHRLQAHKDVNKIIGDFTSLIPFEVDIPANKSFDIYLQEVQSRLLQDLEHDAIGGVQILREMRSIGRDSSMPVVFTSTLGLNDFACDWLGEREYTISQTPQVWIDNQIMQKDGALIVNWDCIDELFREKTLDNMFKIYSDLIEMVLDEGSRVEIERYSPIFERQDIVYAKYNETAQELPTEVLPLQCMKRALAQPEKEAVITDSKRISYGEFHNATAQIAAMIEEKKLQKDEHIAVILPKGWEQIVAVMACGYAGAAYLPMAIDYPKNRIEYLLEEAGITSILSNADTLKMLALPEHMRGIDVAASVDFGKRMPAYRVKAKEDDLAYTIFTSGSTGKPKGVMISHASVCNTVADINKRFNVTADDRFFGISALNFDLSVYDIYGALSAGASLVIPDEEKRKDAADWFHWVVKEKITLWNSVPALMKLLCQEADYAESTLPESLRLIMMSGDFIPLPLVRDIERLVSEKCELISLGGATEASIWSIYFPIATRGRREEKIPYGYPLANQQLFVLDEALDSRPYLVHGDIYIKGKGVADGYFNDPLRTKAQFIEDPVSGEVLYKTGDIGYFNPKGYIDIVGRSDEQVKIQGYRVELGEIEQHMLELPNVKEAVVLAKEDENKHNMLVAYVTAGQACSCEEREVKQELSEHIPEYMVPTVIMQLDQMPLTANGKIDKKTLAALKVEFSRNAEYVAPRNGREELLTSIFEEVLQLDKVGVFDSFFELGGHSLLATQLVSKIRNEMGVELPLKDLFFNATVDTLANYIETSAKTSTEAPIEVVKNRENLPLSFSQERLWFIDQLEPNSADYNLPMAVVIEGKLDAAEVEAVLKEIISRHETLRTVFPSRDGAASLEILEETDFALQQSDLSGYKEREVARAKARELAQQEALTPFDLVKGPLLRAHLITLGEQEHILVLNMHHIISDGWSIGILFKEFDYLLTGRAKKEKRALPDMRIDYADYSVWQRQKLEEGSLEEDLAYWEETLIPYPSKLNVSKLANQTEEEETQEVTTISKAIDPVLLAQLDEVRKSNNWTLNQILLSVYAALIYRYTNNGSMVIAVPNANRPTSESEEIIGFFVNTMLIKLDVDYSASYSDLTEQVKEKLFSAIEHQNAPLQNIIESIRAKEGIVDMDDSFQFAFNSLPMGELPRDPSNPYVYEVFDIGIESAKTLLTMTLDETKGETDIQLTYKSSLLCDEKVAKFLEDYHQMIGLFCRESDDLVMLAPVLDAEIIAQSDYSPDVVKAVYPFTQIQRDMYLQGEINFHNKYVIGWYYAADASLDVEILKRSIKDLFRHIDVIHTAVVEDAGVKYQLLLDAVEDEMIIEATLKENESPADLIGAVSEAAIDPTQDSSVKAVLVMKEGVLKYVAYMGHHAIMDGLSLISLKTMVDKHYKAYMAEQRFPEVTVNTGLNDIASLMKRYNPSQKEQWRETLRNVGNITVFNAADMGEQQIEEIAMDKTMLSALNNVRKQHKVPLFALLNAIYVTTLYRFFDFTEDIVLYEPLSGRKSLKDASLGVYLDVRPVVIKAAWFENDLTLVDLAKRIDTYQKSMTEPLSLQDQATLIPAGDVIFGINYIPRLKEKEMVPLDKIPLHEVQFTVFSGSTYILKFTYPEHVFNGEDIGEKFLLAAESLLEEESVTVLDAAFIGESEREEQLSLFGRTFKHYTDLMTIHQRFEKQAAVRPEATAVVYEGESLSYAALNTKANVLAHFLIAEGVETDDLVGICVNRSLEMIVGLLAILKAGGAYLPIDPSSPKERISYILEDSRTKLVLTETSLLDTLSDSEAKVVDMSSVKGKKFSESNPNREVHPHDLAYVIYTSGSTGKPKGVMLEHANADRLFLASQEKFQFTENDSWTLFHSFAFDFSVWEIWGALLHGGKLHILSYEMTRSSEDFYHYLIDQKVTVLNQTPAAFNQLIHIDAVSERRFSDLRVIVFGGEKLDFNILSPWYEKYDDRSPELINMYGITETTVHVTYHSIRKEEIEKGQSFIGYAYDDLACYLLDAHNNLLPKGLPGELHVAGDGLARGYLWQEAMTEEKFIDNPFAEGKLYKTGDLVRFLDDGSLEYLGRIDDQVKVRGFRIELGEIEHQLLNLEQIDEAVVLVKEDKTGGNFLMSYVTTKENKALEYAEVKAALSEHLPEYMLPTSMLILDQMPLTSNGKIDKKALDAIEVTLSSTQEYVAARNETEEQLCRLFAEILSVPKVGIYDNFFDLGGHSLLATQLVSKIRAEMHIDLPLKVLFDKVDVYGLSEYIRNHAEESMETSIPLLEDREAMPLSFSQERLWFLEQFSEEKSGTYHIPGLLYLKGSLDKEALNRAMNTIVSRHEVLRTTFALQGESTIQRVDPFEPFTQEESRCSTSEVEEKAEALLKIPFDLEEEHLFRVHLFEMTEEEHALFINMHHIISDGWSVGVLIEEFIALYHAYSNGLDNPLPALPLQFGDYAAWQKGVLKGVVLEEKLSFWTEALQGIEPLALPTTYSRPPVPSNRGKTVSFSIPKVLSEKLAVLSKEKDVTLFMTLLSAFSVLMQKYSGQEEIAIGSPIANRNRAELEGLIGFFVNTLVLKQSYSEVMDFETLLQQTKERTLSAYEHQDVPFEKIVDALDLPKDTSRSPLFQVMFALQNTPQSEIRLDGLEISLKELRSENAKFDMTMELTEVEAGLKGSIEYATDLFSEQYIERLIAHFTTLLASLVAAPEQPLSQVEILSPGEKEKLIKGFFDSRAAYDKTATIHSYFEAQAAERPAQTAVVYETRTLSYGDLNAKANQLAHYLIAEGVKTGDLVAISLDRSFEMIISLLAVLKAGAAYVPVDTSYPQERIDYIIADSKVSLVLNDESLAEIDSSSFPTNNPKTALTSSDLAYVIYTSGSTGQPKGVMLEHRGVVNLNEWYSSSFNFNEESANLIIISFGFDAVQKNIFSVLKTGGKIVLPRNAYYDADYLAALIETEQCTHLNCVPSAFYPMLDISSDYKEIRSLEYVLVGGEASKKEILDPWLSQVDTKLVNVYGPTECNDISLYYCLEKDNREHQSIPIGRPIHNVKVYIVDAALQLLPKGVPGELLVSGDALSRGYLYQEEMTAEKFMANPFGEGKVYRTGDLVKYLPGGNIEYLGRVDDQVKIRGFRIELGEIEQQLLLLDTVKDAVVLAKESENGQKILVAYVTAAAEEADADVLKTALKQYLPDFMIPSAFIFVETLPFTANGKVDKKALLRLDVVTTAQSEYVAPRNEEEEKLAAVFADVLHMERVGINDSFFDLGGNSILSVQVTSKAKVAGLEIKLPDLFQGQNVANIIELMHNTDRSETVDLEKEAQLDENIKPLKKHAKEEEREVFLTGATGFVGRYFLHELLQSGVEKVHCLVRGSTPEHGLEKLQKSMEEYGLWDDAYVSRISVVLGDLVAEQLGIDDRVYANLCEKVDRIYHSAVYMNPMANYDFLAEVNVAAIEKILRLASTGQQKPIEYISTVNIFNTLEIANEYTPIDGQKHLKSNGYAATKFLAEKIILMAQQRGFDINIYRLGLVIGDSRLGRNDRSQWFYKLLNAAMQLKALPDFQEWNIPLTPVDFVAKSVVALAGSKEKNRVYHIAAPFNVRIMDLVLMYNSISEEKIEIIGEHAFLERVEAYNENHERLPISDFITENMKRGFAHFVKADNNAFLHSFKTFEALKAVGICFPDIDEKAALRYFESSKNEQGV